MDTLGQLPRPDNRLGVRIQQSLEEGTIIQAMEERHKQTRWLPRTRFSLPLSLQIRNDFMLGWFLEINALIAQLDARERGLQEAHGQLDLGRGDGVEWVKTRHDEE